MHPNRSFRAEAPQFVADLVDQISFGMVVAKTPNGLRTAHTPFLRVDDNTIRFHLAKGNALARHLEGQNALIIVNGPDAYISPRWYEDADQVPTWNYLAAELEGTVQTIDQTGLRSLLNSLTENQEAKIEHGEPWTINKMSQNKFDQLLSAIVGFEMTVEQSRETAKLSQNKPRDERARLMDGLNLQGNKDMAQAMRGKTK